MGAVFHDEFVLLLLLLLLFGLFLPTRALATVSYLRRYHSSGLFGNVAAQESTVLLTTVVLGLIFLSIAFIVGSIISPALLTGLQQPLMGASTQISHLFGSIFSFLLAPTAGFVDFLERLFQIPMGEPDKKGGGAYSQGNNGYTDLPDLKKPTTHHIFNPSPSSGEALTAILKIAIPLLLVLLAIVLTVIIVRRLLKRRSQQQEDQHESLWSWSLFWMQFKAFFQQLFARLLSRRTSEAKQHADLEQSQESIATPTVRSVREIYRAMLKKAASRGYPREQDETPYEFEQRLGQQFPFVKSPLTVITQAYITARYSQNAPTETEVAQV